MSYFASIDLMPKARKKRKVKDYPTGYSPSVLPFYSNLDDQGFEHFCTDLLNRQPVITVLKEGKAATRKIIGATLNLGGKEPQKGKDIWAKDDCGEVWIFQCKHVKSFGQTDVSEVIRDAENGFPEADHFVLVITCGLSEPAQQLIRDRPKWLLPWDPDRLTTVVFKLRPSEDASSLVRIHFGPEMAKKLFPGSELPLLSWQDFFRRDLAETDKHFRHTIPFIPWSDALQKLMDFAQNDAGRALILNAPGGQGKSRLLLELAKEIEKLPHGPRVRFLNINQHGLSSEQSDFLAEQTKDLLLIIDDAHRLGSAIEDVARAAEKSKSIRLLIATRPQAVETISSQLYQNGFSERLDERLDLPRWERDDICKLAEEVLKTEHRAQTKVLVDLADGCPLLVVLGADLINSGEHVAALADQRAFRERVFKSFKDDFLRHYPERRERLDRVISFLSFISPRKKDDTLLNNAAEVLGYRQLDIADDLDALDSAGLLAENWEGIRLYPDLFSDAVLLDACLDSHKRPSPMHKTVLGKLKLRDFPALIRNVAQADWESRSHYGVSDSLFDPIWDSYIKDFRDGRWPQGEDDFVAHWFGENPSLRAVMLEWWEPVAVFLPERTLELAEEAIKCMEAPNDREWACRNVPPLLKSIVERHPKFAEQALDLLWTLARLGSEGNNEYPFAAITAIAEAASFTPQKEISVTELVLSWLERKFRNSATIEFLRRPRWILSALLKPFFVTEIGEAASRFGTYHDRSEKTLPIRQRVLAIIDNFLKSSETRLGCALIPVLAEASNRGTFVPKEHLEAWRQDCLDVFKVIEAAVKAHPTSPILLTPLRILLRNRRFYQDPTVHSEANRILKTIRETLELRVARALTSYAHLEFPVERKGTDPSDPSESEKKWIDFNHEVAVEISTKFGTAHEACKFLRSMAKEFQEVGQSVNVGGLLQQLAQVRVEWCAPILKEMVEGNDPVLDHGVWDALFRANKNAAQQYREAVEYLPLHGRSTQVSRLINFLGYKHANIGGLVPFEREAIAHATKRMEEAVISELAWLCGFPLINDPTLAMDILSQLQRVGKTSGDAVMLALGRITEEHASKVEAQKMAKCLRNVGGYCFPESSPNDSSLTIVAKHFPKEVYEHLKQLFESAESESVKKITLHTTNIPSLGPLKDVSYVDREIQALWDKAIKCEAGFSREFRLALIRSLIWADAATALDRTRDLVVACKNADEIKLLAELVGSRPSRFVFDHPEIVRSILRRAQEFAATSGVTRILVLAACGGSRTYTDTELDPEYKYILEQGDALANRFRDDPLLQPFYREIANSERQDLEWHRQQKTRSD